MAQELNIRLNTDEGTPLYRQIYTYIRDEIRRGSLEADERLPSTRALAAGLHVARSTAELAYSQLLSEGYIRAKKNSGYYVNEIENLQDLHFGGSGAEVEEEEEGEKESEAKKSDRGAYPAALTRLGKYVPDVTVDNAGAGTEMKTGQGRETKSRTGTGSGTGTGAVSGTDMVDFSLRHTEMSAFPYSTWKRIMREVMVDANSEMFSHSEPGGDRTLRTTIARYLHFSRGVRCTPDQVIVGAGNDYLLMLLRHILGEGRNVAMEDPSYLRAAQIFSSFGYQLCPVRMDEDGMMPESVAASGADLVYAMPAHQFPMGCVMPVARRVALLGWAMEKPDRYIIEDDYDSEFRYRGKPIPALQSLDHTGRVIYIGTFSKAIAPAIRISYMILPPDLLDRYRDKCWFFSSTVSRIDQRILNEFMKNGHFERHLNRMRSLYRARHDELLARLRHYDLFRDGFRVLGEGAGLHLVLEKLPQAGSTPANRVHPACGTDQEEHELARRAGEHGVVVYCMSDYRLPGTPDGTETAVVNPTFLLGFGALDEEHIREGIRRLYEAWKS